MRPIWTVIFILEHGHNKDQNWQKEKGNGYNNPSIEPVLKLLHLPLHVGVYLLVRRHALQLFSQLTFDSPEAFHWFAQQAAENGGGTEEWTDDHDPGPTLSNED